MSWLFDGIGSTIVGLLLSLILGLVGGGAIGYRIGVSKTIIKQAQKNETGGNQVQIGTQYIKK